MNEARAVETKSPGTPPPATQRRKERMRRRIIEVATELYEENGGADGGFEKTTVEAIAERADISVRTFFRYFDSKTDVIFLDCKRAVEALVESLDARLMHEPPVAALVGASLDRVRRFVADPINRTRLQRSLLAPQFRERLAVLREQHRIVSIEAMAARAGNEPGALDTCQIAASIVRGTVGIALDAWAHDPSQDPEETMLRILQALAPVAEELALAGDAWRRSKGSHQRMVNGAKRKVTGRPALADAPSTRNGQSC